MSHESWLELADVYALGTLDGDERRTFETHLATGCAGCGARIRETGETLMHLARTLPPVPAPPAVRERVLAAVSSESRPVGQPEAEATLESRPARARRARHLLWWGGWATALGAAGLLVVVGVSLTQTREELEWLRGRVAVLQDELTEREATLRFLSDPKVRYVSLGGLAASPAASGWLLWNPETRRGLLLTRGLPPAPADRAYELWAIAGSDPVPAGVFGVDQAGRALFRLPALPGGKAFDKFAVTQEPAGGVPKPSGPMHLLGTP